MIIKIMKARLILMMLCAPFLCGAALDIKEIDHIEYRFDGNIQGYKKKGDRKASCRERVSLCV